MKYISKITEIQMHSVKSYRHAKKPTSLTSVCRSVLAKLQSEKVMKKCNDGHYKKGADKHNDGHYGMCKRN